MRYRVFRPTVQGERRWGYYWRDRGRLHQKIRHPETGEPFPTRASVERWISEQRAAPVKHPGATVAEVGEAMFDATSPWALRQARRRDGRPLAAHTLAEHELNFRLHIEPAIGAEPLEAVDMQMVAALLDGLDLSSRARRNVAATLRTILKDGVYRRIISTIPLMELPSKKSRKPSVLTVDELRLLFPTDRQELRELWAGAGLGEPKGAGLAIAACAACMFFGGLRPQEARAVGPDQLLRPVLLVTRSMDSEGRVLHYAKMGGARDPRYRGTLLVDRALAAVDAGASRRRDFLFIYQGAPIRPELLHSRLQAAAVKAKIPLASRRLIPYSGRTTFNTILRPTLPPEVLMLLMGHHDAAMTDLYDVPALVDRMKQLGSYLEKIEKAIE